MRHAELLHRVIHSNVNRLLIIGIFDPRTARERKGCLFKSIPKRC